MNTPKTVDDLFPSPWLKPDDLNGRSVTVTIKHVTFEYLHNPRTNQKELKAVLDFGRSKRLPLNKTQALAVADIAQSRTFTDWPETAVTLRPGMARNHKATITITPAPAPSPAKTQAPAPPAGESLDHLNEELFD